MRLLTIFTLLMLSACAKEPTSKNAENTAETMENNTADSEIRQEQLSIEEAAEKATRLIEEDAQAEIDAALRTE